jgi:hypothetical protein
MTRILLAALIVCLAVGPALAAGNLVANGSFEKGKDAPLGWHIKLTDFMPQKQGDGSFRYICACGHDLGDGKPYCGLLCPKCGGYISGEECGAWYVRNHERVSLDGGRSGRGLKFTLPTNVGNNQGVRVFSYMIKAKRGWGYKLSFDTRARGAHPRVFVECFRHLEAPRSFVWNGGYEPTAPKEPIERCYRAHVNCEGASGWRHYTKDVVAPKRYRFDYMVVKLYAYMPGEAWFDNVSLRPMTSKEMREYLADRKTKDKRFEY